LPRLATVKLKRMKPTTNKRVVITFPQHPAFLKRMVDGILDYAREGGRWSVAWMPEFQAASLDWLRHWPGDGAFVFIASEKDASVARSLNIPVVNFAALAQVHGLPTVMVDHRAVGRLAAEHLLARHFQQFGFYGSLDKPFSELRRDGFRKTIQQAGGNCHMLEVPRETDARGRWTDQPAAIERWVRLLPRPVGIMACNDPRAGMVLDACLAVGLRVPGEAAIIGADNDPVICAAAAVPLSSVARRDREVGCQAAQLLDRLMSGSAPPVSPILVPPEGVVQRRSTESYAVADPQVQTALTYLGEHLGEPFGVERLLAETGLSRRPFEIRFKRVLGKTPHEFILAQRVERARQMLAEPGGHNFTTIVAACGFTEPRHLRAAFQRVTGQSPAEYRLRIGAAMFTHSR
jgi:LacI family transcriptional regulator